MSIIIGLTGGIGAGKSTVAAMLAEHGAVVIDADRVAHESYRPASQGYGLIVERFGHDVVAADGSIDRQSLGGRVFNNPKALADLNAIIHPLVRKEVAGRVVSALEDDPQAIIVIEAALMTETGWSGGAGTLWVVVADPSVASRRLIDQRGMDPQEVKLRMATQLSNQERRRVADRVIENNGTVIDLEAEVEAAWSDLQRQLAPA